MRGWRRPKTASTALTDLSQPSSEPRDTAEAEVQLAEHEGEERFSPSGRTVRSYPSLRQGKEVGGKEEEEGGKGGCSHVLEPNRGPLKREGLNRGGLG